MRRPFGFGLLLGSLLLFAAWCVHATGPQAAAQAPAAQPAAQEPGSEPARFHHVLLNVTNPRQSNQFYSKFFGASPIKFRGGPDAMFVEKSFILFNKVDKAPSAALDTGIWHIGWGGVDVKNEYEWWLRHGATFQTPVTPLTGNDNFYMYFSGPDKELIEINTMGHHRFGHVHFLCDNVNTTAEWYVKNLGLTARPGLGARGGASAKTPWTSAGTSPSRFITCDNVQMIFYGVPTDPVPRSWKDPAITEFKATEDHAISRIGFSYRNIQPVYERMKANGVKILLPLEERPQFKMKSFVVEAPNKVSVEIVEARPIPEGTWE